MQKPHDSGIDGQSDWSNPKSVVWRWIIGAFGSTLRDQAHQTAHNGEDPLSISPPTRLDNEKRKSAVLRAYANPQVDVALGTAVKSVCSGLGEGSDTCNSSSVTTQSELRRAQKRAEYRLRLLNAFTVAKINGKSMIKTQDSPQIKLSCQDEGADASMDSLLQKLEESSCADAFATLFECFSESNEPWPLSDLSSKVSDAFVHDAQTVGAFCAEEKNKQAPIEANWNTGVCQSARLLVLFYMLVTFNENTIAGTAVEALSKKWSDMKGKKGDEDDSNRTVEKERYDSENDSEEQELIGCCKEKQHEPFGHVYRHTQGHCVLAKGRKESLEEEDEDDHKDGLASPGGEMRASESREQILAFAAFLLHKAEFLRESASIFEGHYSLSVFTRRMEIESVDDVRQAVNSDLQSRRLHSNVTLRSLLELLASLRHVLQSWQVQSKPEKQGSSGRNVIDIIAGPKSRSDESNPKSNLQCADAASCELVQFSLALEAFFVCSALQKLRQTRVLASNTNDEVRSVMDMIWNIVEQEKQRRRSSDRELPVSMLGNFFRIGYQNRYELDMSLLLGRPESTAILTVARGSDGRGNEGSMAYPALRRSVSPINCVMPLHRKEIDCTFTSFHALHSAIGREVMASESSEGAAMT